MMKNLLFTVALTAAAVVGNAQNVTASKHNVNALNAKVYNSSVKAAAVNAYEASAPRKTRANGVFYERPTGVWYSNYTFGEGYAALHFPALVDFVLQNRCTDPAAAKWSVNGNDLTSIVNAEHNLPRSYSGVNDTENGYDAFYMPTITVNNESFSVAPIAVVANKAMPITVDNPTKNSLFSKFTDGPIWGTGSVLAANVEQSVTGSKTFAISREFEKPASPMYLTSVSMPAHSSKAEPLAGKTLTMHIYAIDENGKMGADPKETLTCSRVKTETNANLGFFIDDVQFTKTVTNEFGDQEAAPVVIDYPFAIVISGYDQEGVDIKFYGRDLAEDEFEFDASKPAYLFTRLADGKVSRYFWKGSDDKEKWGYAFPIIFNALYDNVEVRTEITEDNGTVSDRVNFVKVSDDGTTNVNFRLGEGVAGVVVSTATPWTEGSDYHYSAEYPEWITAMNATEIDPTKSPCVYLVSFTAQPLPAGVAGRGAFVYIKGRGAQSAEPIFVFQGDVDAALATGIDAVSAKASVLKGALYNLSGQKVSNSYKGIVIRDGKKFVQ